MVLRLLHIAFAFWRYRLDLLIPYHKRPKILRAIQWLFSSWGTSRPAGARFADALERQGVAAVKLGQILSNRPDLLSPEVTAHMARLRTHCEPVPFRLIEDTLVRELQCPIADAFVEFNQEQVATASLAQVHKGVIATDQGTREVAIKVLKPNVSRIVERDIRWIRKFITALEAQFEVFQQLGITDVLTEFETGLLGELDLRAEAANTIRCRNLFKDSDLLLVPEVFEHLNTRSVMVMEWVDAVEVSDKAALIAKGVDLKKLAEDGVEIFSRQVYDYNFFHGDMHPGNILVQAGKPHAKYVQLDMAVAGSLSRHDTILVVQMLRTIMRGDFDACARVLIVAGISENPTSEGALSRKLSQMCGPILARPIGEISIGNLLMGLFEAARELRLRMPASLALLGRTIFNIEGMGRELYPQLDFWSILRPRLDEWARVNFGPQGIVKEMRDLVPLAAMRIASGQFGYETPFNQGKAPEPAARAGGNTLVAWVVLGAGVLLGNTPGFELVGGALIATSALVFVRRLMHL